MNKLYEEEKKDLKNKYITDETIKFSGTLLSFAKEYEELKNFINSLTNEDKPISVFIYRNDDIICYGIQNGEEKLLHRNIHMSNSSDLIILYELINTDYANEIEENYKHVLSDCYLLTLLIKKKIFITINSNILSDKLWILVKHDGYVLNNENEKNKLKKF